MQEHVVGADENEHLVGASPEENLDLEDDAAHRRSCIQETAEKTSGSAARPLPQPVAPSEEAQNKHLVSGHVPLAAWFKQRVRGRAKGDLYRR